MNSLPKIPADESLEISSEGLNYILSNFSPECPERNFVWTTDYKVELPVRVKKSGPGSEKPYTFCEMWKRAVKAFPNNGAINFEASPDKWVTWNYQKYYD